MELAKSAQQHLRRTPGLLPLYRILRFSYSLYRTGNFRFVYPYTPGDYYSPLPDRDEVLKRSRVLFERDVAGLPGIALREEVHHVGATHDMYPTAKLSSKDVILEAEEVGHSRIQL